MEVRNTFEQYNLPVGPIKKESGSGGGYFPLANGKPTTTVARLVLPSVAETAKPVPLSQEGWRFSLVEDGVQVFTSLADFAEYRLGAVKLLDYSTGLLTQQLSRGNNSRLTVSFPLKEYASLMGIDATAHIHESMTEEEQRKEKTRADNAMKKVRKSVKTSMDSLYRLSLSWKEKTRGKNADYSKARLVSRVGIRNGVASIEFASVMADYLANAYIMQFPVSLLSLNDNNQTAYSIGRKMAQHATMDSNVLNGRHEILSVHSLLMACGRDPSKVTNRRHKQLIIMPLERDLDLLQERGVIKSWEYCRAKGEPLTEKQLEALTFSTLKTLYVKYIMEGEPMATECQQKRLEVKREERTKIRKQAERKKAQSIEKKASK